MKTKEQIQDEIKNRISYLETRQEIGKTRILPTLEIYPNCFGTTLFLRGITLPTNTSTLGTYHWVVNGSNPASCYVGPYAMEDFLKRNTQTTNNPSFGDIVVGISQREIIGLNHTGIFIEPGKMFHQRNMGDTYEYSSTNELTRLEDSRYSSIGLKNHHPTNWRFYRLK